MSLSILISKAFALNVYFYNRINQKKNYMKTMYKLLLSFVAIATFALFISCEGPEGPVGPAGTDGTNGIDGVDGTDGVNGTDGTDGVDGNVSCLVCHTQANMDAVNSEYALSGHSAAANVTYTSGAGRASCVRCHNDEGFKIFLAATPDATVTDVYNATKVSCGTCHGNHESLEDGISAPLTASGPVKAIVDAAYSFDVDGPSNLCMNCHQSRSNGTSYDNQTVAKTYTRAFTGADIARYNASPAIGANGSKTLNGTSDTLTVVFDVPTTNVYLSNTRAYPHYGPMANVLHGIDGYTTETVTVSGHKAVGCVKCHMGESGDAVGGHTFFPNVANCTSCHSSATDFNIDNFQTEVEADLALIEEKLIELGALYLDADGHPANLYASLTRAQFEAYWNYQIMAHDVSLGVHNPKYYEAMITQAKTNLGL